MAVSARQTKDLSTCINLRLLTRILAISFVILNMNLLLMLHRSPLPTPLLDTSMLSSSSKLNLYESQTKPQDGKATAGKFAYIFLMAGCDPKQKERYIGYVLNILISKYILKQSGSNADVVVLARMSSETTDETISEQSMLEKGGVIVRYLPKSHMDNFYSAMLDKFQILKYHQEYDRILFLDSDITPFCNLDYMFHNSMGTDAVLAPNVVLSYKHEPAQGGFFMLHPEKGDYEKIQEIIDHRMQRSYNFSEEFGWGHKIEPPDYWDSMNAKNQTRWDFYGACEWSSHRRSIVLFRTQHHVLFQMPIRVFYIIFSSTKNLMSQLYTTIVSSNGLK
jgi:hypothetical protein